MTIEEMRARKKELGLSNKELALRSGVPLGTLQKIFSGATSAPRRAAIEALEKALAGSSGTFGRSGTDRRAVSPGAESRGEWASCVKEAQFQYGTEAKKKKTQGEYTLEDYYAIPDDRRVELIDGVIYDMSSPSNVHQAVLSALLFRFTAFVKKNKGGCRVYPAPFDVQLDRDNRTMVQPDISVICDRGDQRLMQFGCCGAPDLVVEILSPSTARKDLLIKLEKYIRAGVREYWIVNLKTQQVIVYENAPEGLEMRSYSMRDQIPVGIWDGRCVVDFEEISEDISGLQDLQPGPV